MLPVPTETVVLSLPAITATRNEPCVSGSSAMISFVYNQLKNYEQGE